MSGISVDKTGVVSVIEYEQSFDRSASEKHATQVLRDIRDKQIASGISVGDIAVQTDDISQLRISGAAISAMLDENYSVTWKCADGVFRQIAAQQILAIATAVRSHVQACFDKEAQLVAQIKAAEDPSSVDLNSGWPA